MFQSCDFRLRANEFRLAAKMEQTIASVFSFRHPSGLLRSLRPRLSCVPTRHWRMAGPFPQGGRLLLDRGTVMERAPAFFVLDE
jgi:hypothetical protein